MITLLFLGGIVLLGLMVLTVFLAMCFRTVVPTNDVHIVQSGRKTIPYGKDQVSNVYYSWPSWVPVFGVKVIRMPVSVFDIKLNDYAAYDKGRVPFAVDIMAFFRVDNPNMAAQRVSSFQELQQQLMGILQGASRSILASSPIEEILEERAKYGKLFTEATNDQLKAWGVVNVKNIELMDIRDSQTSKAISNIMAMKQSLIEKDSRVQVASNKQAAQTAEIDANRAVLFRQQEAEESVGVRTAQKAQLIGVNEQKAQQAIQTERKETSTREMEVLSVNEVRRAEIAKQVGVTQAEQTKQVTITTAEGDLQHAKLNAAAVQVEGEAEGKAETAKLMAPVNSQIALAKEIGANEKYQQYLVTLKGIEANQAVGIEQAKALGVADIKVISNVGTPPEGLRNVMDIFSAKGGTQLGAALEAIVNTPTGKAISEKLGLNGEGKEAH